jgi:hypothetical protein
MTEKKRIKKKDYERMAVNQLLQLEKKMRAIKRMPELVNLRNLHLLEQNNRNKEMDYERIRQSTKGAIPPYMANKHNVEKVLRGIF